MKFLACAIETKLDQDIYQTLFLENEWLSTPSADQMSNILAHKLHKVLEVLDLYPVDSKNRFKKDMLPFQSIEPLYCISPNTAVCQRYDCDSNYLLCDGEWRDIPTVTLVKNNNLEADAYVFHGKCPKCQTMYYADHMRIPDQTSMRVFLNDAKYLKVGQSIWVDRIFSNAVISGLYNFHASANAYPAH